MEQYRVRLHQFGSRSNQNKSLEESSKDCLKIESSNFSKHHRFTEPFSELTIHSDFDFYDGVDLSKEAENDV